MNNIVDVKVLPEKIILKITHKDIVHEIDNVVFLDSKTKKLISSGVSQKEFQEKFPKKWNRYKNRLEFHFIFDTKSFNPEVAGVFLWKWWNEMTVQVTGNVVLRSQVKLELNILFEDYESMSFETQQEFEYILFRYLYVRKLTVNGKEKQWDEKNKLASWLLLALNYIFIVACAIISAIPLSSVLAGLSTVEIHPFLSFIFHALIILGVLYALIFIGYTTSTFLWLLSLKPFVSRKILFRTLQYQTNLPRKRHMDKPTSFLAHWILALNE